MPVPQPTSSTSGAGPRRRSVPPAPPDNRAWLGRSVARPRRTTRPSARPCTAPARRVQAALAVEWACGHLSGRMPTGPWPRAGRQERTASADRGASSRRAAAAVRRRERVLLRDGPNALTSRAVTDEAGCAKGVLHRHFADFDAFLTDLVLDRAAQLESQAVALRESAGTGTVVANLTGALTVLFGPIPMAIIPLVTFRDQLRERLRHATPAAASRSRPGHDRRLRLPCGRARSGPHRSRRRHRLTHPFPGRRRASAVHGPRTGPRPPRPSTGS